MNNDKKEKFLVIILVMITLLVIVINIFNKKDDDIDTSIILLNNRNRFFEVSSSVDKFIKYVSIKDKNNILKIFNSDYLKDNNITENNILDKVPDIDGNYTFSASVIYQQQLSKTVYKYYIKGNYSMETIDDNVTETDYYIIVYFYTNSMTFSVEPYDGKLFKE